MTYDRSAVMRAVKSRDTGLSDDYRLTVIARRRETPVAELACRRFGIEFGRRSRRSEKVEIRIAQRSRGADKNDRLTLFLHADFGTREE